jgi:hypothetical protein
MRYKKDISVNIEIGDTYIDTVTVEFILRKENSGEGHYEFWGFTGFDEGQDYYESDSYEWDKSLYTEEQNKEIQNHIDERFDYILQQINKEL